MPGLITHYLCGDETIKNLSNVELKDLLLKYRQVFNLGTQGPDILFYYRVWPWSNNDGVSAIGDTMHEKKVTLFFKEALNYIVATNENIRDLLTAYICGYGCHYCLDANTHPYIFYKTGDDSAFHRHFETSIDFIMLQKLKNKRPLEIKPHTLIKTKDNEALEISKMYSHVLNKVYDISIEAHKVNIAIKDMSSVQRALLDRTGIKKKLLSKAPLISNMIYPLKIEDSVDYLDNSSFLQMFKKGVEESEEICNNLYKDILTKSILLENEDYVGNRSFTTGVNCDL